MRILFTGGGTAGHINPAVAVANFIKEKEPDSEFLFIGSENGMEATLVPEQGYNIRFIKIHGFQRKLSLGNVKTSPASRVLKTRFPKILLQSITSREDIW